MHRRYELAAIPTTVVADADGVVRRAFVGAFTATDLWAAVAELRDPGSTPEPDLGQVPEDFGVAQPSILMFEWRQNRYST